MRVFLYFLVIIFVLSINFDVQATNYPSARIKRYAINTPRQVENNIAVLTRHLVRPLDDDYDKAKMIAFWIASHISYDEYFYNNGKTTKLLKQYQKQTPQQLLISRAGICGDFAALFSAMCKQAGIFAGEVHGYAYPARRSVNNRDKKNSFKHVWNYFNYRGKKIYVDTTFMSKGSTGIEGGTRNLAHKNALRKIKDKNKYVSQTNDFDEYYFDFNYKNEKRNLKYIHEEE